MSPLKISSEERAGEEWKINELIESKTLKQLEGYISYNNNIRGTSIRFTNYKIKSIGNLDSEASDSRRYSISECVEKLVLNDKIKHYEEILKKIDGEYKNAMTIDWPKIREKDRFLIKEISRIKKLQKNKSLATNSSRIIEENKSFAKNDASHKLPKDMVPNEEEKWDINNNILLESYEEEEEEKYNSDIFNDSDNNIDFLDDESIHNLENATEAMEVELGKGKTSSHFRYTDGASIININILKQPRPSTLWFQSK
jgi:hypothetical protein